MGGWDAKNSNKLSSSSKSCVQHMYFLEGGLLVVANLLKTDAWVQDEVRTHCNVCVQQFLPFRRRHHCRTCGEVVCSGCSSQRTIRLTDVNVECSTRVCTFCMIRATDASIKANETAIRGTMAMDKQYRPSQAPPPPFNHQSRRQKQFSIVSMESDLTVGSVVQLWPQPIPDNEHERLEIVRNTTISKSENDPTMNLLVSIVARTLVCPVAFIGILDDTDLWFKASIGWDQTHIPRDDCVCSQTLAQESTIIVPDTNADKHFYANNVTIAGRPLRYYAGAPIRVLGQCIGAVCAIDIFPHPHTTSSMKSTLEAVANIVSEVLEQRIDKSRAPTMSSLGSTDRATSSVRNVIDAHSSQRTTSAIHDGDASDITGRSSSSSCNTDSTLMDLHASLRGLNLEDTSSSHGSSSGDLHWNGSSDPSMYLILPSVPQEYGDKIATAMELFQRLQSSGWTTRPSVEGIKTFEMFHHGRLLTKSNAKLPGKCTDVVGKLLFYEDPRIYHKLFSRVARRYKVSDQTWMDDIKFQPGVRAAGSEELRVLSHWRQYPDGSSVIVAMNGAKIYEADERDFLFGWLVAPCSLDDGLGSVNVSCIVAQPFGNQTQEQNLSCNLLLRLQQSDPRSFRLPSKTTSTPNEANNRQQLSFVDNQSNHESQDSFISVTSDGSGSGYQSSITGSAADIVSVRQNYQPSQLNQNERMMLDLLDRTISTQEILAAQQQEMASVIGYHGSQLQRISTAIDRVESILADNGSKIKRLPTLSSCRSLT